METEELEFTKEQQDRIDEVDNTCYNAVRYAATRENNLSAYVESCLTVARVMTEHYEESEEFERQGLIWIIAETIAWQVDQYLANHWITADKRKDLNWDIEIIGQVADDIAALLVSRGYTVRYPYIGENSKGELTIYDYE